MFLSAKSYSLSNNKMALIALLSTQDRSKKDKNEKKSLLILIIIESNKQLFKKRMVTITFQFFEGQTILSSTNIKFFLKHPHQYF